MRLTDDVHALLDEHVATGDTVVDATAGNGHDTRALLRMVGATGRVYAFDVQQEAITATRDRIAENAYADRVELVHACHSQLLEHLQPRDRGQVAAVVFNLGYLPGGDHAIVTRAATTIEALRQSRRALRPGGLLCVLAYTGHEGGPEEAAAVERAIDEIAHTWLRRDAEDGVRPRLFAARTKASE